MIDHTWPAFEPHNRSIPTYLRDARARQMFARVTSIDGLGLISAHEISTARHLAGQIVTAAADRYTERYDVRWTFSSMPPIDEATEAKAVAGCLREGAFFPVSDAGIDDHIYLTDEAEGSYQFWRAVMRNISSIPFGRVGDSMLSLLFLDRIVGDVVSKESALFRLLEAHFWADHFAVESGHSVRDQLGYARKCIEYGPQLALFEEHEAAASWRLHSGPTNQARNQERRTQ